MMPELTDQEIARYIALGDAAKQLVRSGELDKAEAAYRAQIALFPPNPAPYAELALMVAGHGSGGEKQAIELIRAVVARGFTDLNRIKRAEGGARVAKSMAFLQIEEAVPYLTDVQEEWDRPAAFRLADVPIDVSTVEREKSKALARIDHMAPVLGERLTRLWRRTIDRIAASLYESYVAERGDAPDLATALERLMSLYAGGSILRWEALSPDAAHRIRTVARTALEKFPESPMRAGALTCVALSRYGERDAKGALSPGALETIRSNLDEVLTKAPDSPFAATAIEGLVNVELEAGRADVAAARFRDFRERHSGDARLLASVRDALGALALRVDGLPQFAATALDGSSIDRGSLAGKVTVVDFWATWCRPCVDEFPTIRRIAERHGEKVSVVGFSLDSGSDIDAEALRTWIAAQKLPGRQVRDGASWDSEIVRAFGVKEIPFTVLVDGTGAVLAVNEHGKALEKAVATAVGK